MEPQNKNIGEVARRHFLNAQRLRKEGRVDDSIGALLSAIKIAPDYAMAHNNLGFLYEQKNDRFHALSEYREAIRLDPEMEIAYVNMGALLLKRTGLSGPAEAVEFHRMSVSLFPLSVKLHYNLGNAYASAGQTNLAISEYKEAIQCDPTFGDAYANLGRDLVSEEDWVAASEAYQQAITLGVDEPALRYSLGEALIQLKRTSEAVENFKEILRSSPKDAEAYLQIGRSYLVQAVSENSRESFRLAEEAIKKSLSIKPYSLQAVKLWLQLQKFRR